MATTVEKLRGALSEADFPAEKAELVRYAEQSEADADTLRALRAIPAEVYADLGEVERSVSLESPTPAREEAARRRTHDKPGVAEREKDIPQHPIVEEIGENRGS